MFINLIDRRENHPDMNGEMQSKLTYLWAAAVSEGSSSEFFSFIYISSESVDGQSKHGVIAIKSGDDYLATLDRAVAEVFGHSIRSGRIVVGMHWTLKELWNDIHRWEDGVLGEATDLALIRIVSALRQRNLV